MFLWTFHISSSVFFAILFMLMNFCPAKAANDVFQYLDSGKNLTIQKILDSPPDFEPVDDPLNINFSFSNATLWLKIEANDESLKNFIIENAHLDTLICYYTSGDQIINLYETGDRFSFDTRPIHFNYFIFPIPRTAENIYLKIQTPGALNVPIRFFTDQSIIPYIIKENSITLIFFGVTLVILLLNLLLYIRLKESLYLYYFLHVSAAVTLIATNEGYMFMWFWPNSPLINQFIIILYSTSIFLLLFSEKFLNLKNNSRALYWVFRVFYASYFILIVINLFGYYTITIYLINLLVFLSTFLFLFSGFYVYYKVRDFPIVYYLVGWGLYAFMALIYTLSLVDIVPLTLISMKAIHIGGALEMIILFLAIVYKIEVLKKERGQANQKVIELLIEQEEYLQNQNKLLEEGVQSKTRELNEQKKQVESKNKRLSKNQKELKLKNEKLEETLIELKDTQSQLISTEKLAVLGQLTAGIAHELNNPINFIKSGLEGLKAGMDNLLRIFRMYDQIEEKNFKEQLKKIEKEKQEAHFQEVLELIAKIPDHISIGVNRATDLVKELRSYSHKDTKKELTDINKSLDSSLIILYNEYKYNITIEKHYGNIPGVYCFPSKINQVFINLLANAIDAVKEKLKVKTSKDGEKKIWINTKLIKKNKQECVLVEIQDNGIGMKEDDRKHVFIPFQTSKSRGTGLGLGLFISESIIKDHNGHIEFISEYLKGTTFKIFLPAVSKG